MHFSVYIWRKTNLYNKQSTWKSSTNWSRYAFINELVIDTLKIANNTKSLQLRPWTTIITVVICCDWYKTKTINKTKLLCVCACLGLQIGHFRTAGPYMVRSDYPLLQRPYCLFPLLGTLLRLLGSISIPSPLHLACYRQPFPDIPTDLFQLGGTYAGLEILRLILIRPGFHNYYENCLRK